MNVQCEKCGTGYGLDETLVGPSGTTVRCTVCGHVFKVYASGGARTESWVLRQASGATFPFDRLGTLQDWIAEGKVSEQDLIAKTGGEWKRLSDLAEMKPFFDAARGRQLRREVSQPVAAGFVRNSASDYAATIRQAPLGQAPAPAPQPPAQHVTAAYEVAAASRAPMARPAVAPVAQVTPTVRSAPLHSPAPIATAPTQMATHSPIRSSAHETADTIQAFLPPSQLPQAPAPFAAAPVSDDAPTLMQVPSAAYSTTIPAPAVSQVPATPAARPAPARPRVATFQPWQEGPEAPPQAGAPPYAEEPDLSQVPAGEEERWVRGHPVATPGPAWAEHGQPAGSRHDYEDDEPALPRRRPGRWIALSIVVLLVGGAGYMYLYQRETLEGLVGGLGGDPDEGRFQAFLLKGQESFLLDTDVAFRQADREFQKALALADSDATTLASLAVMYAVWSQYLRDTAIDAELDARSAADGGTPDMREVERLGREAKEKLDEARRWAEQAAGTGEDVPLTHVALADVARLRGDLEKAGAELARANAGQPDAAAGYVAALIEIDRGKPPAEVAGMLSGLAKGDDLLRVLYRRARVLAAAGRTDEARRVIDRVIALNGDHERAKALIERLEAGHPVALLLGGGETGAVAERPPADPETEAVAPLGTSATAPQGQAAAAAVRDPAEAGGGGAGGGNVEAMLTRALRLQENGQTAQAIEAFEAVLERQPGNIDAMSGLGYCNLDRGNKGQAISWFRRALGGGSGSYGPAIIGLAETYKAQGQKAEALKWYRRYIEVHPGGRDAALARSNLERLEQAAGAEAKADGQDGDRDTGGEAGGSAPPSEDKPAVETPYDKPDVETPYDKPEENPAEKPTPPNPDPYSAGG